MAHQPTVCYFTLDNRYIIIIIIIINIEEPIAKAHTITLRRFSMASHGFSRLLNIYTNRDVT